MENEQLFKADETLQSQSSVRLRPSHLGHDFVKIATGGIEVENSSSRETAPLLAGENGKSKADSNDLGDGGQRAEQYWSGDKDFEGRPWWNKPSVGCNHLVDRCLS